MLAWLFGSRNIKERLSDLESAVQKLKSDFKAIEGDWESTYRKLHAARQSINQKLRMADRNGEDAPESTNGKLASPPPASDIELLRRAFPRR